MKKQNKDEESQGKDVAIEQAIATIQKSFGKGSIMCLGDETSKFDVEAIPTGSLGLDLALGVKGLPKGRIIEMFGPEMSGKSTMALHTIREAQKLGNKCAYVDMEHALDIAYARQLGVDTDKLYLSQPDCGETALAITDTLVRSGAVGVVVVDSVAALVPRAELEGEMGQSHMGLQARLMSQALRKITGSIQNTNTVVIFINQIRMKIGVMFGNPEVTTGGNALKFYASVRLDIRKRDAIRQGDNIIGHVMNVKVVKNKVSIPFKECKFSLIYGKGIDYYGEVLDLAVEKNIIDKSGAWFKYNSENIGQGRDAAIEWLEAHPGAIDEITKLF